MHKRGGNVAVGCTRFKSFSGLYDIVIFLVHLRKKGRTYRYYFDAHEFFLIAKRILIVPGQGK